MSSSIEPLLEHIEDKLKMEDIAVKVLLKPIEIALNEQLIVQKALLDQGYQENKSFIKKKNKKSTIITKSSSDIANGLKIVVKSSIEDNKYTLKDLKSQAGGDNFIVNNGENKLKAMKELQQDNLLYFLKADLGGDGAPIVKTNSLSICVCMYSEPKSMLRDTLRGVEENVVGIVKSGTNCDEVTVVVVIDGIETMNKDMVSFFEETERITNTYIEEQDNADYNQFFSKKLETQMSSIESQNLSENVNFNYALYNEAQLEERNRLKFKNIYKKYAEIKDLKQKVKDMMKNKPIYETLPGTVKNIFMKIAKEEYEAFRLQMGILNLAQSKIKERSEVKSALKQGQSQQAKIISFAINNMSRYQSILMKALQQTQKHCDQYISNREKLAYLASFRKKLQLEEKADEQYQKESLRGSDEDSVNRQKECRYMNLLVCVKYKNSGKLSSHNWFFNGFCKQIHPKYTVLLDVGLRPNADALFKMYSYLRGHEDVGGVCGYMGLKIERLEEKEEVTSDQVDALSAFMLNFVDIQRAQQLEYHFAHLIDKPFESLFDFIHVLPGAFSAYNMTTLTQIDGSGHNLLKEYFKSIDQKLASNKIRSIEISSFGALVRVLLPESVHRCLWKVDPDSEEVMLECENINLAQDRILCMGIHKVGKKMHFLPDAYSMVDPMKTVHSLMGQRRRWINGSMFAFNKVKSQISNQNNSCELFLELQLLYISFLNLLSYVAPAILLFTVHLAMGAFRSDVLPLLLDGVIVDADHSTFFDAFVYTVDFIYVLILGSLVFLSLNLPHSDQKFRPYIYFISTILGLLQLGVFILFAVDLIRSTSGSQTFLQTNTSSVGQLPGGQAILTIFRWLLVSNIFLFAIPITLFSIIFKKFSIISQMILGLFSSIFYSPTYLIILNIFAICRIDDISWGTKGLNTKQSNKSQHLKKAWKTLKYIQVYKYIFWNMILGVIIISFGSSYVPRFFISLIVLAVLLFTLVIKIIIGGIYLIKYACCTAKSQNYKYKDIRSQQVISSELMLLKKDVLQQVRNNLTNINKDLKQYQEKKQTEDILFQIFNSNTPSKINFMKKINNNTKNQIKKQQQSRRRMEQKYRPNLPTIQQKTKIGKEKSQKNQINDSFEQFNKKQLNNEFFVSSDSLNNDSFSPQKEQITLKKDFHMVQPSKDKKYQKKKK